MSLPFAPFSTRLLLHLRKHWSIYLFHHAPDCRTSSTLLGVDHPVFASAINMGGIVRPAQPRPSSLHDPSAHIFLDAAIFLCPVLFTVVSLFLQFVLLYECCSLRTPLSSIVETLTAVANLAVGFVLPWGSSTPLRLPPPKLVY